MRPTAGAVPFTQAGTSELTCILVQDCAAPTTLKWDQSAFLLTASCAELAAATKFTFQ